jgi:hypothetical protein
MLIWIGGLMLIINGFLLGWNLRGMYEQRRRPGRR